MLLMYPSLLPVTVVKTGSLGSALKSPVRMTAVSPSVVFSARNRTMSFPCSFLRVERRAPLRAFRCVVATHTFAEGSDRDRRVVVSTT